MAKAREIFNDLNLVLRLNQHIEEITSNEASATSLLTKETSFKVLTELSSLSNPDPREEAQFDHQRANFRTSDASTLPFHLQGDQTFNEASALARRRQLRHCETVKDKIQFLWQVARGRKSAELTHAVSSERIRKLSGASRASPSPVNAMASAVNTINEREYSEMMLLIFKVLRDDFVLETAKLQIQCDWEVDSHHGDALTYDQFFPALFELVDVWTCDILEGTYVRFLELLARRITVRVVVFLDDMKLKLALSDNFDEAVVVKAIPLSTIKRFAPVAKVLEGSGVRTIGELAGADPKVVETQRTGYLERNAFSRDKIGADLQHLLDMFRDLSQQFQGADYSFDNKSLHRSGPIISNHYPSQRGTARGDARHHDQQLDATRRSTGSGGLSQDASTHEVHHHFGSGGTTNGQSSRVSSYNHDSNGDASRGISNGEGYAGDTSRVGSGRLADEFASGVDPLLRRGIKRINTFHDISVTETGVIDALKSTFLIEKGISIQRKTSMASIQAELTKFGVDTKVMDDAAMESKYAELYEMFVLRDGENIQALAQSILTRIKMELAAHGIEVDDAEAEAMYDGFFGSVVAGSGERMVADAKSWVDTTVSDNSYKAYVKEDYHELKSISEVARLGDGAEDAEFVSLLSTEDDDDGEDDNDNEKADIFGNGAESPTTKAAPSLSRRPSLRRGLTNNPKKENEQGERSGGGQSSRSLLDVGNNAPHATDGDQNTAPTTMPEALNGDEEPSSSAAREGGPEPQNDNRELMEPSEMANYADLDSESGDLDGNSTTAQQVDDSGESDEASTDIMDKRDLTKEECASPEAETVELDASTSKSSDGNDDDDDANRRKSLGSPILPRLKTAGGDDTDLGNLDGNHAHDNESDREPQGVGYEYEGPPEMAVVEARAPTPEVPVPREPKIPDIVVSGVDSGRFISVTARYIQLLGLGNVKIVLPETSLMELLNSPDKADIDLLCFDVGSDLNDVLAKATELVALIGPRVILFGGDERESDKSSVIARLCVSEVGVLYFATVPVDFTALRGEILAFFEASPHLFVLRQRRATGTFSSAAKLLSTSIRATNMMSVEDDHPRSVMTPPLSADHSGAKAVKRKATATSSATPPLPQIVAPKREVFSPFRPLRVIDEMPGADLGFSKRLAPVVPPGYASKSTRSSPRISAALKKFMR